MRHLAVASAILALMTGTASAAGKGQGGCSIKDGAPVYNKSTGDKVIAKLNLNECVVGVTTRGILGNEYVFEEENGRVHVAAFWDKAENGLYGIKKEEKGNPATPWMDPADLSNFTFDCGCGTSDADRKACTPYSGIVSRKWNPCFLEGRQKKIDELKSGGSTRAPGNEKALRNEDVLSLIKVGLDDALIATKIQQSTAVAFDLSTEGIVAMRKFGASNAVIDAMMKRSAKQ